MIAINESACSAEFNAALSAIDSGKVARRASWPGGMYLRKRDGSIAVYREDKFSSPTWHGPRGDESNAEDWEVV